MCVVVQREFDRVTEKGGVLACKKNKHGLSVGPLRVWVKGCKYPGAVALIIDSLITASRMTSSLITASLITSSLITASLIASSLRTSSLITLLL